MGREVKRVPLDFDWPLNKTWGGYLMPDTLRADKCEACHETGSTPARQWVSQITALLLMLDDDLNAQQRGRPMHPYFTDTGSHAWGVRPSADILEFGTGLAGREASFMGHDSIDNWRALNKVIESAGLDPKVWGICAVCNGAGSVDAYTGQSDEAEAWECTEPPPGDGWQLWETVSEGSPISPVFDTPEGLANWMAGTAYTWGTSSPMDPAAALRFVVAGWAPSGVVTESTGFLTGEAFVGRAS